MNLWRAGNAVARALVVATLSFTSPQSRAVDAPVVEFYNAALDNYFITANANEAAAIDGGAAGPGWVRTGETFMSGGSTPVCRFYGSISPGPNSHFYTVIPAECQSLKDSQFGPSDPRRQTVKSWNFESLDFVSTPPTGAICPAGTMPVYRAYNNGAARGIDSNHRITASYTAIQQVVALGWKYEGVVMCGATSAPVLVKVVASVAPGLPAFVSTSIEQVNTLYDAGALGASLSLPMAADARDGLVVALDANDNLRLASVEVPGDGKIILSADSTALALVRISIGSLPSGLTAQSLNETIRATAAYPALVTAINQALAAGAAPPLSLPVVNSIATVSAHAMDLLRKPPGRNAKLLNKSISATVSPPFSLLGDIGSGLDLVGTRSGTIELTNCLPIYWSATANSTTVLLDPIRFGLEDILSNVGCLLDLHGSVSVPDAGGRKFTLRVEQNSTTKAANVVMILRDTLSIVLDNIPGLKDSCKAEVTNALISAKALDTLYSIAAFKAYLHETVHAYKEWASVLRRCTPDSAAQWGADAGRFIGSILKIIDGVSEVTSAVKATGLVFEMQQWAKYLSFTPRDIQICETGTVPNLSIANCAVRIEPSAKPITLAPGAIYDPAYTAFDSGGLSTGFPADLKVTSTDSSVVDVDANPGKLTAGAKTGSIEINLFSPSIPLQSKFGVTVVDPKINPATPTVIVGSSVTLQLVDDSGQPVNAKGANESQTTWIVLDKDIAEINALISYFAYPNSISVLGRKVGTTTITAWNLVSGKHAAVNLTVTPAVDPARKIQIASASCSKTTFSDSGVQSYTFRAAADAGVVMNVGDYSQFIWKMSDGREWGGCQGQASQLTHCNCGPWTRLSGDQYSACRREAGQPASATMQSENFYDDGRSSTLSYPVSVRAVINLGRGTQGGEVNSAPVPLCQ